MLPSCSKNVLKMILASRRNMVFSSWNITIASLFGNWRWQGLNIFHFCTWIRCARHCVSLVKSEKGLKQWTRTWLTDITEQIGRGDKKIFSRSEFPTVTVKHWDKLCPYLLLWLMINRVNQTIHIWSKCRFSVFSKAYFYIFWFHHLVTAVLFICSPPFQSCFLFHWISNILFNLHVMTSLGL